MQTLSADEFKKKYGEAGMASFTQPQKPSGAGADIANAFQGGISQAKEGYGIAANAKTPIGKLQGGMKELAGGIGAALSPLAPVTKYIGQAINYAGDKLSSNSLIKGAAGNQIITPGGAAVYVPNTAADAVPGFINDTATVAGTLLGGAKTPAIASKTAGVVSDATQRAIAPIAEKAGQATAYAKTAVKDIVPDTQRSINHQISKGLDFTPGDLARITESTGNDVGNFMSDHNLIGTNKKTTQGLLEDFHKQNYESVRSEIKKVDDMGIKHDAETIPGYKQATSELSSKIVGVPGLEKEAGEIKTLADKTDPTLADVQRVKELIDKHNSLYSATGDVSQNIAKQGLANIRHQLQTYIETQVQQYTKADIRQMNNNVATTRAISDTITQRDPKGLTKANLSMRDLGAFWFGSTFGGPLGGAALLFMKKVAETPTVRLRIARYLDSISDARKAAVKVDLEAGKIPPEFNQFIKKKGSGSTKGTPQKQ